MTSAAPAAAPDPQLAQQLEALLQHTYSTTPAADAATQPPPSASASTSADDTHQQPTFQSEHESNTTPEPPNSRTAPLKALPLTTHLLPVLSAIAATGRLCGYPWPAVRELLTVRARIVLDGYVQSTGVPPTSPSDPSDSFEPRVAHLLLLLSLFAAAPFTLQRLAELLCEPRQHYSTTSHYLAALCKCVYGITADEEDDDDIAADEDEAMYVAELEAAGVQVTSAMDYVNKELPIVTVMPNVLSVEPSDDHTNNMETSE